MAKTKDEILADFQTRITNLSTVLIKSKVRQEEINTWAFSAKKVVELREQIKWMKQNLAPAVQLFLIQYRQKTTEAWELLASMNKFHPDFKVLEQRAMQIRKVWRKRPRFNTRVR